MATNIKDYSTTQADNTSLNTINVAEGMLPSNLNNAIRALMKNTREMMLNGLNMEMEMRLIPQRMFQERLLLLMVRM